MLGKLSVRLTAAATELLNQLSALGEFSWPKPPQKAAAIFSHPSDGLAQTAKLVMNSTT